MKPHRGPRAHPPARAGNPGRRSLVVALLFALVAVLGVPGGNAHADHNQPPTPPPGIALPGYDITQVVKQIVPFYYTPVDPAIWNITADSPLLDLDLIPKELGTDPKAYAPGTVPHLRIRWWLYRDTKKRAGLPPRSWESYQRSYATVIENGRVGDRFEKFVLQQAKLGPEWSKGKIDASILPDSPEFDLHNVRPGIPRSKWMTLEMKAKNTLDTRDRKQYLDHLRKLSQANGGPIAHTVVFAGMPTPATVKWLTQTAPGILRAEGINLPPSYFRYCAAVKTPEGPPDPTGSSSPSSPDLPLSPDSPGEAADDEQLAEEVADDTAAWQQRNPQSAPGQAPAPQSAPGQAPAPQAPGQAPAPQSAPGQAPAPQAPAPQAPAPQAPAPQVPAPQAPAPQAPAPQAPAPAHAPAIPQVPVPAVPQIPVPAAPHIPVPAIPAPVPIPAVTVPIPAMPIPIPSIPLPTVPAVPLVAAPLTRFGGIDFSNLELSYVTDSVHGKPAMQYAFSAGTLPADQATYGGQRNAAMAMDSFYVWLSLQPSAFWVNLNPNQPDRIIDAAFGRTQAGQVLLEADLAMKEISGQLQHPDTDLGRRFTQALQGSAKCLLGRRQWIVPMPAVVHQDGDQLYILDAPLTVKIGLEPSDVSPGQTCAGQDPAITEHNGQLYQDMIMPAVADAVNHDPQFADLRRVYRSRVAAEWYRNRNVNKPTQYAKLIDSGNIDKWTEAWNPRDVFDRYVDSFKHPKPTYTWTDTVNGTVWTHTNSWGGVDFSKVETHEIGAPQFDKQYASLARTAGPSIVGPLADDNGKQLLMGDIVSSVPLNQIWTEPPPTWVPYLSATPLAPKPLLYMMIVLPAVTWLVGGGYLLWRRRRLRAAR